MVEPVVERLHSGGAPNDETCVRSTRPGTGPSACAAKTMLRVDQWLHEQAPAPDLAESVRCVWRGDLGAMQVPLPDECFDLVWVNDGSMSRCAITGA